MKLEHHTPHIGEELNTGKNTGLMRTVQFHSKKQIMEIVDQQIGMWKGSSTGLGVNMSAEIYRFKISTIASTHDQLHSEVQAAGTAVYNSEEKCINPLDSYAYSSEKDKKYGIDLAKEKLMRKRNHLSRNNSRLEQENKLFAGSDEDH
jgi:hypothetical protein